MNNLCRILKYFSLQLHLTALHWATKNSYPEIMELLIKKGADLHAKDIVLLLLELSLY